MNEKEILKDVCKIVSEHLEMPLKEVKKLTDVPFAEYRDEKTGKPLCDELEIQELILAFDWIFDVEILEVEDEMKTINDVVDFIANYEREDF